MMEYTEREKGTSIGGNSNEEVKENGFNNVSKRNWVL
jgi:hypothetical protein